MRPLSSLVSQLSGSWQVVRRSLKSEFQAKAAQRNVTHMKVIEYDGGKVKAVRKLHLHIIRVSVQSMSVQTQ